MDTTVARQQAAMALEAGQKLARRAAQKRRGLPVDAGPSGNDLGALIGNPAAFWACAAVSRIQGDDDTVVAVELATRLAGARLATGDMGFVRDSLIGQSQWLGVMATELLSKADAEKKPDAAIALVKLSLAAQRQAAQCLASAAALEKLRGAGEVVVGAG